MLDHAQFPEDGVLHIRRILPASADEVWRYLVEDRLRRTWFCAGNVSDKVGGSIEFKFDDSRLSDSPPPEGVNASEIELLGQVEIYDRPNCLAFTWPSLGSEPPTRVTISLRQTSNSVRLCLVHQNLHSNRHRIGAATGWHAHLDILTDHLSAVDPRDFWIRYIELKKIYAAIAVPDTHDQKE